MGKPALATKISLFCRIHKSKICSFRCRREKWTTQFRFFLFAPGLNLFRKKTTNKPCSWMPAFKQTNGIWRAMCTHKARGCTFKWSPRRTTHAGTQATATTSSTWLNEQCKWGYNRKGPGLCQTLWEDCHLCSPAVFALILQVSSHICSSKTHTGLKLLQSELLIVCLRLCLTMLRARVYMNAGV